MEISGLIVLSVIIAPRNVDTPYISKTNLPIVSINVRELEFNWCSKHQPRKKGVPSAWGEGGFVGEGWGVEVQLPQQSLKIYYTELSLFIELCIFRMRFSL